jgi:hypothetical protein
MSHAHTSTRSSVSSRLAALLERPVALLVSSTAAGGPRPGEIIVGDPR